ncbi:PREDICTED: spindle assembly checkpoint component MAD1-like [Ceratosolen solmsi marchali]|uniref:Spindle assembly checkpoint component MAD1-like n=1 Tax=Ceratosolen solmsi marchali TaxID=326594 RepID=A0AAJ6YSQ4_9HYME|nr:PREDICTED: spindle assembly checkpoint component MAD1-like [Ceratosolen solmsi marchali]
MSTSILTAECLDKFVTISKPNIVSDDHIQSLDLDINDCLPKFKLNEPGPTALASSVFQQNNIVQDESDQSFVVLGKTSIESVREASLTKFIEIQKTCTSTDKNFLISSKSPLDIEENFKKVLKENIKLKEIVKENNNAIKQQFNAITMWQKEVMTVCDNHKQKFLETKDLISHLKKENDELREQVADKISLNSIPSDLSLNIAYFVEKDIQKAQTNLSKEDQLLKKSTILSQELSKEFEDFYAINIDLFNQSLQNVNKKAISKQKSGSSDPLELQKHVDECCDKDLELKYHKEIITSLEQQIKKMTENVFPVFDLVVDTSIPNSKDKYILQENIEFYNKKLAQLGKCFASQCSRYLQIQNILKESDSIINIFENSEISVNNDKAKNYKDKLCLYRKRLIDEQLEIINDRQITIQVQKQFQKILSDYNSIIYKLEILKDENSKLLIMQNKLTEENSQKLVEIEKYINQEKKKLDNEKTNLLEERLILQIDKKLIIEGKEKNSAEYNIILLEKEKLIEERENLLQEKTSLASQSRISDVEITLQNEKKILEKKCKDLSNKVNYLNEELNKSNEIVHRLKGSEETVVAYSIQMEMYEKEFKEMCITHKNLQDQFQVLSMTNLQLQSNNV